MLGVGGSLIPQRLDSHCALFRHGIVLVHHARFDSVKETTEALDEFTVIVSGKHIFRAGFCLSAGNTANYEKRRRYVNQDRAGAAE